MGANPLEMGEMGVLFGSSMIKTMADQQGIDAKEAALDSQMQQEKIATSQRLTQQAEKARSVLADHNVMAGASGATAGSFSPVEEETFNRYAEDRNATQLDAEWKENALQTQEDNLENSRLYVFAGDLAGAAESAYNVNKQDSLWGNYSNNKEDQDDSKIKRMLASRRPKGENKW